MIRETKRGVGALDDYCLIFQCCPANNLRIHLDFVIKSNLEARDDDTKVGPLHVETQTPPPPFSGSRLSVSRIGAGDGAL